MEIIYDVPTELKRFFSRLFTIRMMLKIKMFLLICAFIMYFLSPFDLVPDALFGIIGVIDDIFVVFILLFAMSNMFYNTQAENYQ